MKICSGEWLPRVGEHWSIGDIPSRWLCAFVARPRTVPNFVVTWTGLWSHVFAKGKRVLHTAEGTLSLQRDKEHMAKIHPSSGVSPSVHDELLKEAVACLFIPNESYGLNVVVPILAKRNIGQTLIRSSGLGLTGDGRRSQLGTVTMMHPDLESTSQITEDGLIRGGEAGST